MNTEQARHYAVIDTYNRNLTFKMNGEVIAQTTNALILKEVGGTVYNPVFYIPKEDMKTALISDPSRSSHCPIKGDASYWNIQGGPQDNYFAWSYENALPRTKKIAGYLAFNMDYIELIDEPA